MTTSDSILLEIVLGDLNLANYYGWVRLVYENKRQLLEREFAKNEVIQVLNDMECAKALGLDGFTDIFSKVLECG